MKKRFYTSEMENAKAILNSKLLHEIAKKDCDRLKVLVDFFNSENIPFNLVNIKEKKHCVINFDKKNRSPEICTKILLAHYDRKNSYCGANDNSAACVQLAFFAKELASEKESHNIQIIFTDGEELSNQSLSEQGAFLLGVGLRELKLHKKHIVFVFDMCGRGDTLVFSQAGILGRDVPQVRNLKELQSLTINLAKKQKLPYKVLPTGFSDNAGLLASGINAQLITVLPKSEIATYETALKRMKSKLTATQFNSLIKSAILEGNKSLDSIKPDTWKFIHTENDTVQSLTAESFALIYKFLIGIKNSNIRFI